MSEFVGSLALATLGIVSRSVKISFAIVWRLVTRCLGRAMRRLKPANVALLIFVWSKSGANKNKIGFSLQDYGHFFIYFFVFMSVHGIHDVMRLV